MIARKSVSLLLCAAMLLTLGSCSLAGRNEPQDDRITIRLAAPQNSYIKDFDTNAYKLWLEEQTGLKLEMTWLPSADAEQIAQLALTTGEGLPDAYIGFEKHTLFSSQNIQKYGEQGAVIPLDGLIEEYGVHTKALFTELSDYNIKELMSSPDGHFYYMPGFSSSIITRYRQIMWVNKGWLDALNMDVPTTTEEFAYMLRAFQTGDPNGNGAADEIPMAGTEDYYGKQVYNYLFNAFIYNNEKYHRLLLEDGVVGFAPVRDAWRDALRYMSELYAEGLISPLSFTQNDQQLIQMASDPRDILGAFPSPGITYTVQQNSADVLERFVGIGPLKGPDGVQYASVAIPLPKPNGVITSACQYPEEVFKLFDLMLSKEACLMGRYGEQGVDWEFAEKDDVSIYGTPATIRIINQIWNTSQNKHLQQIGPYVSRPKFSGGVTWDGTTSDGEYKNAEAAMLYRDYEPKELVGLLDFTPSEEEQMRGILLDIDQHVQVTTVDFITGKRDIYDDAQWEAYLEEFDALGLPQLLNLAQSTQDKQTK